MRKIFSKIGEALTDELTKIRKHELRINREHKNHIDNLQNLTTSKKNMAMELRRLIDTVKQLDF